MTNQTQNGNNDRTNNVIIQGLGFINRIKEVTPKSGDSYLACDVALLQGVGDNVDRVYLQCTVRGRNAIDIIRTHFTNAQGVVESPENTPVVAAMKLGGIKPELFVYQKGDKKGQNGIALRSVLLNITWLKVGGTVVNLDEAGQQAANGAAPQAQPGTSNGEPAFAQEMRNEYGQNGSVQLSKEHPEFEERRKFLKDKGFTWNKDQAAWVMKPKQEAPAQPAAEPSFAIPF